MKQFYINPAVKFVTALFLLFACSKMEKEDAPAEMRPSYLQLSPSADVRLRPLLDSIWHNPHHRLIIEAIVSRFGSFNWSKGMIGHRNGSLVALIPLSLADAPSISGFVAFEMDKSLRFKLYDAKRPERYGGYNGLGRANIRSVTNVINALNFKTFGLEFARIDDPCAMTRKEADLFKLARNSNPGRKIQLNVRTIEVTTCYSWVSCIGDGEGNCVSNITVHSECFIDVLWVPDGYFETEWWGEGVDESGDGGSGGGYGSTECGGLEEDEGTEGFVVPPPDKPILNVNSYIDCFTATKRAKITFYADQPISGTSFEFSLKEKAGHSFVTIEQNINGKTVVRSLGFYSKGSVDPFFNTKGAAQLGDNSDEKYDVKLSTEVSGLQLASILELIRGFNPVYDLEKYNCTNFALDIADAAGLNINRTIGKWLVGSGLNPGDFGEDLKKLPGAITVSGKSPANLGDCN